MKQCNCGDVAIWENTRPKTSNYPMYLCEACLEKYPNQSIVIDDYKYIGDK